MAKNYFPRSLMGRALLIVVTPLIVLQIVSAYIFYESHWDQVSKRLALGVAGDITLLTDLLRRFPDPDDRAWLLEAAARDMEIHARLEPDAILTSTLSGQTSVEGELRRALLSKEIGKPFRVDSRSEDNKIIVVIQLSGGVLEVTTPLARLFSKTTYIFILFTVGTSLILLGVSTMFMRAQVRPVLRLARAAEAFGKGREMDTFRPQGAREVRRAAHAFIAMKTRIQRQISQRTTMLAGVSHDLRTPLTRMRLELEMMPETEGVRALKDDVIEMERMLEGYLAFARGEGAEKPEPRNVASLLDDVVRQARRAGTAIAYSSRGDLTIPVRPNGFLRCMTNLLENALRYGSRVEVFAERRGGAVEILIDDNGPGVPEDLREEVFKPFYRAEGSRNPETGGVGLGMTIARDLARSHGGDIFLSDSPLGGLRVRVRLPL
ncbi:MAG: two-component sensor histidine kinase [Rhodospirillales bacterium]|nr:two-component sensor histidine kinase [Rhodospirillales bacterium]